MPEKEDKLLQQVRNNLTSVFSYALLRETSTISLLEQKMSIRLKMLWTGIVFLKAVSNLDK